MLWLLVFTLPPPLAQRPSSPRASAALPPPPPVNTSLLDPRACAHPEDIAEATCQKATDR